MDYFSGSMKGTYYYAVDVLGCFDYSELSHLTGVQREVVSLIVSATYVNLDENSMAGTKLRAFFPTGTTRTALDALVASRDQKWEYPPET